MDSVQYIWMYNSWLEDQNEQAELAKNHAYLLASFWNPEAVKKMIGDDGNTFSSTEEEFEESTRMIKEINDQTLQKNEDQKIKKRKRRVLKG